MLDAATSGGWGTFGCVKPPICEVCNERFGPNDGVLVTCVGDDASVAFEKRAETPGFVGHPPNEGWFCARHATAAQHVGETERLRGVIDTIRRNETQSTCEICGDSFQSNTAGSVGFKRTPEGISWRKAMLSGDEEGSSPDHALLCVRHVNPALRISGSLTRVEAMAELMPEGRAPLEYDEKPPSADPNRDETSPPLRGPFMPTFDDSLDSTPEQWFSFAAHPPPLPHQMVRAMVADLGSAFGVSDFRSGGSTGSASIDPMDIRWAPAGTAASASVTPHESGDVVVFQIHQSFREGGRTGPIVRSGLRLLVQQREQSMFEMTLVPADPPTIALDGLLMIERVLVRQSPLVGQAASEALERAVNDVVSKLASPPEDALTLEPDLVGVDLGPGVLVRRMFRPGSTVVWKDIDMSMKATIDTFVDKLPVFLEVFDLDVVAELEHSTKRTWNPMDGAQPPDCPFTDDVRRDWRDDRVWVDLTSSATHWNEHSVANRSANLLISVDGAVLLSLSAGNDGEGPVSLTLYRPTSAAVVAMVRSIFNC